MNFPGILQLAIFDYWGLRTVNGGWMAWQNGILPLRFRTPRCSMGGGAQKQQMSTSHWEVLVIFLRWNVIRVIRWRNVPSAETWSDGLLSRKDANVDNCGFGSDFSPGSGGFMPPSLTMFFLLLIPACTIHFCGLPRHSKYSQKI